MQKRKPKIKGGTAGNSTPGDQVIHPTMKDSTEVKPTTTPPICEMGTTPAQQTITTNEWENWAATYPECAL